MENILGFYWINFTPNHMRMTQDNHETRNPTVDGVLYLLQILSILEAHIYNFMASPSDQILLHMTFPEASHIRTGWQFSSGLGAWTCESCKAVFYFAFIIA